MGRRAATDTIAILVVAFLRHPRWSQGELQRVCGVGPKALRRAIASLQHAGVPLSRTGLAGSPVVWRVERGWIPTATGQIVDHVRIARLVARLPKSNERQAVLEKLLVGPEGEGATNEQPLDVSDEALGLLEDSCRRKRAVRAGYFTASRGRHTIRTLSVQRILYGDRVRLVAYCHTRRALRWFRVDRLSNPELMSAQPYVEVERSQVERFVGDSIDGFHGDGGTVGCYFDLTYPDATWALRALPSGSDGAMVHHGHSGAHVEMKTAGVEVLARFLVSLGGACSSLGPEALRARVEELARGALSAVAETTRERSHPGPKRAGPIGPRRSAG